MKILKYLLFLILIIGIGAAVYFGTQDGTYDVKDSALVNAPAEVVFNKINEYKTWEQWAPWQENDTTIAVTYAEKTSGEGASYSWEGKEIDGSLTTLKTIPNKEIEQSTTMSTPAGENKSKVYWDFEEVEKNKTNVTWGIKGEHSFSDKVYFAISGVNFNDQMHQLFRKGLTNLNQIVVADMKAYSVNVDGITQYGGGYYMYVTTAAKLNEISEKTEPMINQVLAYVNQNGLNMAGKPFSIYNSIDEFAKTAIFSVCIPIKEQVITPDGSPVLCGFMKPQATLKTTLKGNYTHLSEAYATARDYVSKNNINADPSTTMFEVYMKNNEDTPNPADWVTEIYIPLQPEILPIDEPTF